MALKFNTMLLVYDENISFEYGGAGDMETYSVRSQIENGVAMGISKKELLSFGLEENELYMLESPDIDDLKRL